MHWLFSAQLHAVTCDHAHTVQWLAAHRLLYADRTCLNPPCNNCRMVLKNNTRGRADSFVWRCPTCHKKTSIRQGSFFESKLIYSALCKVMFHFLFINHFFKTLIYRSKRLFVSRIFGLMVSTATDWSITSLVGRATQWSTGGAFAETFVADGSLTTRWKLEGQASVSKLMKLYLSTVSTTLGASTLSRGYLAHSKLALDVAYFFP